MFLCHYTALNSARLLLGAVSTSPAPLGQLRLVVGIVMRPTIPWRCTDQRGVNSKNIPCLRHIHRLIGLLWACRSLTRCMSIEAIVMPDSSKLNLAARDTSSRVLRGFRLFSHPYLFFLCGRAGVVSFCFSGEIGISMLVWCQAATTWVACAQSAGPVVEVTPIWVGNACRMWANPRQPVQVVCL